MSAIRPFLARDLGPTAELARATLDLPVLDAPHLARDFLLAPGFRPEHLLVAEIDDGIAGFVLAPRRDILGPPDRGWIAAFGVTPGHRHRGIGTALLQRAIAGMRSEGVRRVDVADVPVRYLLPGVDAVAHPEALRLLERLGFTAREAVASMGIALDRDFPVAAAVRIAVPGELPLLRDFFAEGWGVGWWEHMERSATQKLLGDPTPSEILAWWEDGRPLGVAHYRGHRFGPLAVGPAARGRGIGAALTLAALAHMRAAGFADAYFLVGRDEVQPFYTRLGFHILRRFTKLTLEQ